MPVSGRELSSLDFGSLIGGPLNAVVEAQAKSAIATATFIKEVGFDKDGKVKSVDFKYNRKNDNGSDQEFTLTVPFLTLVPIPYISVSNAEVEFNAKITSTTETKSSENFATVVDASAGGSWWFASARLHTKTAYQRTSSSSDKEERTYDMRVKVQARNVDMPAGTERILTLLENAIQERTSNKLFGVSLSVTDVKGSLVTVEGADLGAIPNGSTVNFAGLDYTIGSPNATAKTITLTPTPTSLMIGKTIEVKLPESGGALTVSKIDAANRKVSVSGSIPNTLVNNTKVFTKGGVLRTVSTVDSVGKTLILDNITGLAEGDALTVAAKVTVNAAPSGSDVTLAEAAPSSIVANTTNLTTDGTAKKKVTVISADRKTLTLDDVTGIAANTVLYIVP